MNARLTTLGMLPRNALKWLGTLIAPAIALAMWSDNGMAEPVTVTLSDIAIAAPGTPQQPNESAQQFLARRLVEQFTQLGFDARTGFALSEFPLAESTQELARTCPVPLPKQAHTDASTVMIKLAPDSSIELTLDSIRALRVRFVLRGELHSATSAHVQWGQAIPFVGNCEKIGTDSGTITVHLPFVLDAAVELALTPQFDDANAQLIIDKLAKSIGSVEFGSGWIEPDFGGVSLTEAVINAFEGDLLGRIRDRGQQSVADSFSRLNNKLAGLDASGQRDPSIDPFNGPTRIDVLNPNDDSATARALLRALHLGEAIVTLLDTEGARLLTELAVLDEVRRKALFATVATDLLCGTIIDHYALPNATRVQLYASDGGNCVVASDDQRDYGAYFSDSACRAPVAFRPTSREAFCATFAPNAKGTIGNAAAWTPDPAQPADPLPTVPSRSWTLLPSTQLNLGVLDGTANYQPYVKALAYKTVTTETGSGTCALEMRAYKQDIAATELRPLLAIHGGTWSSRGFSFVGLESTVREFTNRGFVVFAPFYRLVGADDGNAECNSATWRDVTTDIEDALAWVEQYGPALGAARQPVTVFGQSAGAHLAAWLAVRKSASVARGLLLYPPSDVLAFLNGAVPATGALVKFRDFGLKSLTKLYGADPNNGSLRLERVPFGLLDIAALTSRATTTIPDDTFSFANIDTANPPRYLARCAGMTGVDLTTINDANVPAALLDCLKQDVAEFVVANSFDHQIGANTPGLFVIHGVSDELVPVEQSLALCDALAGAAPLPPISTEHAVLSCGNLSRAHVIRDAQHTLDLGLCAGTLCPAGAPGSATRSAVAESLLAGYDWVRPTTTPSASAPTPDAVVRPQAQREGGGALSPWVLGLVLFTFARRAVRPRRLI